MKSRKARNTEIPSDDSGETISVLCANVGTYNPLCRKYLFSLCSNKLERTIAGNIQELDPDLVFLQETVSYEMCTETREWLPRRVGYKHRDREPPDQIRRLVGDGYSIVCDPEMGTECIAIKEEIGEFKSDRHGNNCSMGALAGKNHSPGATRYEADAVTSPLHEAFIIFKADAEIHGKDTRLVCAHPQALLQYQARANQIQEAFEAWSDHPRVIMAGDFNLDPYRNNNEAVEVWHKYVDRYSESGELIEENKFHYHTGVAGNRYTWPPRTTAHPPWPINSVSLDHVVSNFAYGHLKTLSEEKNLDDGRGMDHDALYGELHI